MSKNWLKKRTQLDKTNLSFITDNQLDIIVDEDQFYTLDGQDSIIKQKLIQLASLTQRGNTTISYTPEIDKTGFFTPTSTTVSSQNPKRHVQGESQNQGQIFQN